MLEITQPLKIFGVPAALLFSGVFGALITMFLTKLYDAWRDKKASKQKRKLWVFRELMGNRNNRLSPDFVTAVNLIELDFYNEKKVNEAWKKYHAALSSTFDKNNPDSQSRWLDKLNHSLADLLQEIGESLGYKMDKLDLLHGAYTPSKMA